MSNQLWDPEKISFRELQYEDLPLMHEWLNKPHIKRWWEEKGSSWEKVVEEYGAYIDGREPVRAFLILYDDLPIGYIQTYRISDDPEYSKYLELEFEAAGIDIFIGEENYVHKGLGSIALKKFLQDVVFEDKTVRSCVIGPAQSNAIAIRAYEKAGFRYMKTVRIPDEDEPEHLMVIQKEELENVR